MTRDLHVRYRIGFVTCRKKYVSLTHSRNWLAICNSLTFVVISHPFISLRLKSPVKSLSRCLTKCDPVYARALCKVNRPAVGGGRLIPFLEDWGYLGPAPISRELTCLNWTLNYYLDDWCNFISQFFRQKGLKSVTFSRISRFQVPQKLQYTIYQRN